MSKIGTSNSFTRDQVFFMVQLLTMLLQGKDVNILLRNAAFSEILNKFKGMKQRIQEESKK